MGDHDEVYGRNREAHLAALLRHLAERILALDREGRLLQGAPELQRLMGDARSELFHYEVRSTYDTPEVADSRRIVEEALRNTFHPEEPEDDDPWRPPQPD
jgi:PAS domain-containing protein